MSRQDQLLKLHESDPQDADVLYMLAQEHAKEGEHARAIEWYDACLRSAPDYLYAYFHKARSLESAGNIPGARESLTTGLERARAAGDTKAIDEMRGYLDSLSG